jgi:hypothetical protein
MFISSPLFMFSWTVRHSGPPVHHVIHDQSIQL